MYGTGRTKCIRRSASEGASGTLFEGGFEIVDDLSLPPFGRSSYIYGRYKKYKSTEVDETFFPIIYSAPGGERKRTEWVDNYISSNNK
jgi:hypothetical protein